MTIFKKLTGNINSLLLTHFGSKTHATLALLDLRLRRFQVAHVDVEVVLKKALHEFQRVPIMEQMSFKKDQNEIALIVSCCLDRTLSLSLNPFYPLSLTSAMSRHHRKGHHHFPQQTLKFVVIHAINHVAVMRQMQQLNH